MLKKGYQYSKRNTYDLDLKMFLLQGIIDLPQSELGVGPSAHGAEGLAEGLIVSECPMNDIGFHPRTSVRLDCLYRIQLLPGAAAPEGFNPSDEHFLVIECEERRLAANVAKHMYYASAIAQQYYKKLKNRICIEFVIIYGPKVLPDKRLLPLVYGNFLYQPNIIYLSQTNAEELYADLDKKIANKAKSTRLDLLKLYSLFELNDNTYFFVSSM
jgi:hypothetical protein